MSDDDFELVGGTFYVSAEQYDDLQRLIYRESVRLERLSRLLTEPEIWAGIHDAYVEDEDV